MKRPLITLCILLFALAISSVPAFAKGIAENYHPIDAIEQDYLDGNISLDQKALLQITALKDPQNLPRKYLLAAPGLQAVDHDHSRCVTMVLKSILIDDWAQLDSSTRQSISASMSRPSAAYTFISPGGFFKLHYDLVGPDAVSSVDDDMSGVPDYVEKAAAYCDTTIDKLRELGYLDPPSDGTEGGDSLYDVYFEEMSYYGYAVPDGPGPESWNDYYSYLVLHRDFIGFPTNSDPEGQVAGAAKATAAHEFQHAVQFAYDPSEYVWFMELDATYIEDIVFEQVNDNYNYLPTYTSSPGVSLMAGGLHQYASFIWGMYLAEKFDTSLMVAIWDGARYQTLLDALEDTLSARYGWTTDSAFGDFASWLYYIGSRDDGLHFTEGGMYPDIYIGRYHGSYPVNPTASPHTVAGYANCLVQFVPPANDGELSLTFDGHDSAEWIAQAILSAPGGDTIIRFILNPGSWDGQIVIPHFEDYNSITLIGTNTLEFGAGTSFTYSASVRKPFAVSSKIVTDSLVYSGAPRDVSYRVYNTSELDDVYDITIWDTEGWAVVDTIDRFIKAGDSATVAFTVSPPEATPLSTQSIVTFRAESRSDAQVWDEQMLGATTVLQRGDFNFTGEIDISDLTGLVNFLFLSGPPPQPVEEAGNVNCEGGVDISDLSYLVNFLFLEGPSVPCNPF